MLPWYLPTHHMKDPWREGRLATETIGFILQPIRLLLRGQIFLLMQRYTHIQPAHSAGTR